MSPYPASPTMPPSADYPLLHPDAPEPLAAYLRARGVLGPEETVARLSRAGEGNMNLTLRVETPARSLIVKQSRPWVEKYPQIAAPEERALVEAAFYRAVADFPAVAGRMPGLRFVDADRRVLVLDDLGPVADFTPLYRDPAAPAAAGALPALLGWLGALHGAPLRPADHPRLANRAMRRLNHEHLFRFPLLPDNGLALDALTPGLQAEADRLKADPAYVSAVEALGARYLEDGPALLHGDFFPGSWVRAGGDVYVIDPEFGFFGPPEFDLGVLLAHLLLARVPGPGSGAGSEGASEDDDVLRLLEGYPSLARMDRRLVQGFAGVEIMRRLVGVAQLPVPDDLPYKRALLRRSAALVRRAA